MSDMITISLFVNWFIINLGSVKAAQTGNEVLTVFESIFVIFY